jgi:hypothetical protein
VGSRTLAPYLIAVVLTSLAAGPSVFADPSGNTAAADSTTDGSAPPKKSFFSSLTQALKQGLDPKGVRGYFDIGSERYYCLVDTKTGVNDQNGVQGQLTVAADGSQHVVVRAVSLIYTCPAAEKNGTLVLTGTQAGAAPSGLPSALEHLFAKSPFVRGTPLRAQFPRVAFTVLESPRLHALPVMPSAVGVLKQDQGCWKLSAVIWQSAEQSTSVEPFSACFPNIIAGLGPLPVKAYENWWGIGGELVTLASEDTTGDVRTTGPLPPAKPFPQGVHYIAYFHSSISVACPEVYTLESYFWAGILYRMDFDPAQTKDRRAWVVKFNSVEG